MNEKIITEQIVLTYGDSDHYTFPEIQKHLNEGYLIKQIFYGTNPHLRASIVLTVHLVKNIN